MKKSIISFLCLCFSVCASAQTSIEEFKDGLQGMASSITEELKGMETTVAETYGVTMRMNVIYSRASNEFIYDYECFSEDFFNVGNLEDGADAGIAEMFRGFNKEDPSGETLQWFLDGLRDTNTTLVFRWRYESQQKEKRLSPIDVRKKVLRLKLN